MIMLIRYLTQKSLKYIIATMKEEGMMCNYINFLY